MKVKDVMTAGALKHCNPQTKVTAVARMMQENNRGALPVLDTHQKVIGIITDRDICLSLAAKQEKSVSELSIRDILSGLKIHTVKPKDSIKNVLREMRKNKIGRLPVTDSEGKLKGMISINNILSRAVRKNKDIGKLSSKNENLAKTIKALFDRDNSGTRIKKTEPEEE